MLLISDGLLVAGALAAAFYCFVLARRVRMLGDLDNGLGSAIAGLSQQVEDLQAVLASIKAAAGNSQLKTDAAAERAERAANRLQLLLATTQLADEAGIGGATPEIRQPDHRTVPPGQVRSTSPGMTRPRSAGVSPQPGELA